jgi:hypothetical protein
VQQLQAAFPERQGDVGIAFKNARRTKLRSQFRPTSLANRSTFHQPAPGTASLPYQFNLTGNGAAIPDPARRRRWFQRIYFLTSEGNVRSTARRRRKARISGAPCGSSCGPQERWPRHYERILLDSYGSAEAQRSKMRRSTLGGDYGLSERLVCQSFQGHKDLRKS